MAMIERGSHIAHAVARAPDLEVRLYRHDHEVVLRLSEHGALRLGDAYHFKRDALDGNLLADRAGIGEEFLLEIMANVGDVHAAPVLDIGDESPVLRLE